MFHVGHLNILEQAKQRCNFLIVGVTTDELSLVRKGKTPIISFLDRVRILESINCVDKVIPQNDMDKVKVWNDYRFDVMFVGSDWKGTDTWKKYEENFQKLGVDIFYIDYTKDISSTILREKIVKNGMEKYE